MQLRLIICYVLSLMVANVSAQELVIREPFQAVPDDLTAAQVKYRRVDYNGNPCALIKVGLVDKSATFSGDVVHSEYKQGEWWVYMVEGSLYLKIKTNNNIPKEITFSPLKKLMTYKISFISNALNQPAVPMSEPLLPFYEKINDEWLLGYLDNKGNIAIPATLKGEGTLFENGTARVEYKGDWYFINTVGQKVISPSWSYSGLHLVKRNNKYGYANKNGDIVIPIVYNHAFEFKNNRARVEFGLFDYAFITPSGKIIYRGKFFVDYFNYNYAPVEISEKNWGFIDTNGNIKPSLGYYYYAEGFSEGLAYVINGKQEAGFIDTYGHVTIPFSKKNRYEDFSEGLAEFTSFWGKARYVDRRGFIDRRGNVVISQSKYLINSGFQEGLAVVSDHVINGKYGYWDSHGKIVIPLEFERARKFNKGFAKVKQFSPNYWVWINKYGRVLKDKFGRPYHSEPPDD